LKRWGILVLDDQRRYGGPQGHLARFLHTFFQAADDYGMNVDRNPVVTYGNSNAPAAALQRSAEELFNKVKGQKGGQPELLMFILRGKSTFTYEALKQYADTVAGVPSQAVDSMNVQKKGGDRSFHANLLLKVNTKLGGTTVTLQNAISNKQRPTV
jgi:Piwi domain